MERKTQQTSAAVAGMSVRSARKWQCGPKLNKSWSTRLGLQLQMLFLEAMDVYDCGSEAPAH